MGKSKSISKKILNELQELQIGSFTRPINNTNGLLILYLNDKKEISLENIDKDLELSNIITAEKNRQLKPTFNYLFQENRK